MEPNPYKSPEFAGSTVSKEMPKELSAFGKLRLVLIVLVLGIAWLYALKTAGVAIGTWIINREFDLAQSSGK